MTQSRLLCELTREEECRDLRRAIETTRKGERVSDISAAAPYSPWLPTPTKALAPDTTAASVSAHAASILSATWRRSNRTEFATPHHARCSTTSGRNSPIAAVTPEESRKSSERRR